LSKYKKRNFALVRIQTPASWGRPEDGWDSDVFDHHRYRKAFPSET